MLLASGRQSYEGFVQGSHKQVYRSKSILTVRLILTSVLLWVRIQAARKTAKLGSVLDFGSIVSLHSNRLKENAGDASSQSGFARIFNSFFQTLDR